MTDSFDEQAFLARWRRVEPDLRGRFTRFELDAEALDDLLTDVAVTVLRIAREGHNALFSQAGGPSDKELILYADSVAWRRVQRERRRTRQLPVQPVEDAASSLWDDSPDALDAVEWREALRPILAGYSELVGQLNQRDRDALELILRGGPFTGAERVAIHRARANLRRLFDKLFIGAATSWFRLRQRYRNPPPLVPAAMAVVAGLSFGQYVPLAAESVADPPMPASAGSRLEGPQPLPAMPPGGAAAAGLHPPHQLGSVTSTAQIAGPHQRRLSISSTVTASAQVPSTEQPGSASVEVERATPPASTWAVLSVRCDTELRRQACSLLPKDSSAEP